MEAVGFAASLLTLLSATLSSAKAIHQLTELFDDRPTTLTNLESATQQLFTTLSYYQTLLLSPDRDLITKSFDASFYSDLENLLVHCNAELSQIEQRVQKLHVTTTASIIRKGTRAIKLLLSEEKFNESWKKIQFYGQQFTILLVRAGINHSKVQHVVNTKTTQDLGISLSADFSQRFVDLQTNVTDQHNTLNHKLHVVSSQIADTRPYLQDLVDTTVAADAKLLQQMQVLHLQSTTQYQAQRIQLSALESELNAIQKRLMFEARVSAEEKDVLKILADTVKGLHVRLDASKFPSMDEVLSPRSHRSFDRTAIDTSLEGWSNQSLPRLMALSEDSPADTFSQSLNTVINDLVESLNLAQKTIEFKLDCPHCIEQRITAISYCREAIRSSQKLDRCNGTESSLSHNVGLGPRRQTNLLMGGKLGTRNFENSISEPFDQALITRGLAVKDEYATCVNITERTIITTESKPDSGCLRNRQSGKCFERSEGQVAASTRRTVVEVQGHGIELPTIKSAYFTLPQGIVTIVSREQHWYDDSQQEINGVTRIINIQLNFVPSRQLTSRKQTTIKCSRVVNAQGYYLPGLSLLTPKRMKSHIDDVFELIKCGSLQQIRRSLELGEIHITDCDEDGRSLLAHAFNAVQPDIARLLLAFGADINNLEPDFDAPHPGILSPTGGALKYSASKASAADHKAFLDCFNIALRHRLELTYLDEDHEDCYAVWVLKFAPMDVLETMFNVKDPFVSAHKIENCEISPLLLLSEGLGRPSEALYSVPDKIAFLLSRDVDCLISDEFGRTCLHLLLIRYSHVAPDQIYQNYICAEFDWELKDVLMLLITAGADVYAITYDGKSVSEFARRYGKLQEWTEALEECGFDSKEVVRASPKSWRSGGHTSSAQFTGQLQDRPAPPFLSLNDYLEQRRSRRYFCNYHSMFEYRSWGLLKLSASSQCFESCCNPHPSKVGQGCCVRCQVHCCKPLDAETGLDPTEDNFDEWDWNEDERGETASELVPDHEGLIGQLVQRDDYHDDDDNSDISISYGDDDDSDSEGSSTASSSTSRSDSETSSDMFCIHLKME